MPARHPVAGGTPDRPVPGTAYLDATETGRLHTPSRQPDVIVSRSGDSWVADAATESASTSDTDPATVLQAAVDAGSYVAIADAMDQADGNRLTQTITVDSALIDAGFNFITGDADPLFDFRANAKGLHNARVEGRTSSGGPPTNTLVYANESGQRAVPFLANVQLGFTNRYCAHLAGLQQTAIYNVHMDRFGNNDGTEAGLYCTDNEAGDLGTNHFQIFGLQGHGSNNFGPWIKSESINGNGIGLNGLKLVGFDGENGNQAGTGGDSAHFEFHDAQRLRLSNCYCRGLDPVDYAFWFDFANATNILEHSEIKWDPDVSSGVSIRQYRGGELKVRDCELHRSGGGAHAITGDLKNATLELLATDVGGDLDLQSNGTGEVVLDGSTVGDVDCRNTDLEARGTPIGSFTAGSNEFKTHLTAADDAVAPLFLRTTTDSNGQVTLDWESRGVLFPERPRVIARPDGAYLTSVSLNTATYDQTYYTSATVTVTDDAGATVGSGTSVEVAVRPQP